MMKTKAGQPDIRIKKGKNIIYNAPYQKLIIFVLLGLWGLGCCPTQVSLEPVPEPLTLQEAVKCYNDNVRAVGDFSAKVEEWGLQFYEDQKKHSFDYRGGKIFYRPAPPNGRFPLFSMITKGPTLEHGGEALVVGSNEEDFWMYSRPAKWSFRDTHANAAKFGPESLLIMNPQSLLEFIGLRPIPIEKLKWPYLLYKVRPELNVIEYILPGETCFREIFIDRRSNLPQQISLYDQSGRCIFKSKLGHYQNLGAAMLPGDITLTAPADGSYFRLKLSNYKIPQVIAPSLFQPPVDFDDIADK
ncbi:hypothetical protein ACFL02_06655 [Planctomycetota bacterium]